MRVCSSQAAQLLTFLSAGAAALPQAAPTTSSALPQATPYYTFPVNTTDAENFAIRSNGGILVNDINAPRVLYIDPLDLSGPAPAIATFSPPATGVLGIAELEEDVFYVATEDYDPATGMQVNGTGQIWRLDLSTGFDACEDKEAAATPELVTNVQESQLLNGVAAVKGEDALLVADSYAGLILRIDVGTGEVSTILQDALTAVNATAPLPIGANGVQIQDGYAYFTNSGLALYARVPISHDGYAIGPSEVVVKGGGIPEPDDFAISGRNGAAFITDAALLSVSIYDGQDAARPVVLATTRPTAVRLGEKCGQEGLVYFSTAGNATVGGGIETFEWK